MRSMMMIKKREKKFKSGSVWMEVVFGKESCLSSAGECSLFLEDGAS